jgi:hypothetical protein
LVAFIGPWKELIMNQKMKTSMCRALLGLMLLAARAALQAQFDYTTNADGISLTITNYTGPGGAVAIPTNINGLTVTTIGPGAFLEIYGLTSVTIPGSVTSIGHSAFDLCTNQIQAGGASFGVQSNQFGFNITGTSNIPMVVEASTNLANPVWTLLQSLTLTNGLVYFSEPLQTNSSGRFYRITAP